jgi:hypothetical protein
MEKKKFSLTKMVGLLGVITVHVIGVFGVIRDPLTTGTVIGALGLIDLGLLGIRKAGHILNKEPEHVEGN